MIGGPVLKELEVNFRFALSGIAVLLLAACASTPKAMLAPAPPVTVVVTAASSLHNLINVEKITAQTELALRRYAPAATRSTVTVHFTGTTVNPETSGSAASATYNEPVTYRNTVGFSPNADPQTVSVPSRTAPWLDGFLPGTLSHGVAWSGLLVQGTYSVVDA